MDDQLEYTFRIIGPNPDTLPMSRLAAYMGEVARLMGEDESVHFERIEQGSVSIVARAPQEVVASISPRIRAASLGAAKTEGAPSFRKLNDLLSEDGWSGEMRLPRSAEVIVFPGTAKTATALRAMSQPTSIQGRLVRLEGAGEMVRVGLDVDGNLTARISLDALTAQRLGTHFQKSVRLSGEGRWKRGGDGRWVLDSLIASTFEVLEDADLKEVLFRLGDAIPPGTGKDIIKAVTELRTA